MANEPSIDDPSGSEAPRGILDGFGAYRTTRPDHYRDLFARGMVVLDTATLLDFYRCTAATRADFLHALRRLRDRLWVPHQVLAEFWRDREAALGDVERATGQATAALRKAESQALQGLRAWANRVSLAPEELTSLEHGLRDAHAHVVTRLTEVTRQDFVTVVDTEEDQVVADLDGLLYGRVGAPLPPDEHRAAVTEAASRAFGDYLVWKQLLVEATRRKQDVLLVTGDTEEDWWRLDKNDNPKGPRPELYEEMRAVAGVRLFMMRPDTFLRHAKEQFGLPVRGESIDDVERSLRNQPESLALEMLAVDFTDVFGKRGFTPVLAANKDGYVIMSAGEAGDRCRAFVVNPPLGTPAGAVKWIRRVLRRHAEEGSDDVVVLPGRRGDGLLNGLDNVGVATVWQTGDGWAGTELAHEQGWVEQPA
ncbi:PIN-like domain-containing protein [Saccharothrix deserti]|uniref:PIN-like domain-containing protein n=1 Tax=Saccharothrix deserti TaxID=2593674 RepID=UPI00131BBFF4|nr:PIN-like domain-containing protein [Saccharothrix deserti]